MLNKFLLTLFLGLALMAYSCGDDDNGTDPSNTDLAGTWTHQTYTASVNGQGGSVDVSDANQTITFNVLRNYYQNVFCSR